MTRRRSPSADPHQPDLFATGGAAWLRAHWPQWLAESEGAFAADPLCLWALTFHDVSMGARVLLRAFCHEVRESGVCRASVPAMARWTGSSESATRSRLDQLLAAGIVAVRPWLDQASRGRSPLGYEIALLVDEDDRQAAADGGFVARRPARWPARSVADA